VAVRAPAAARLAGVGLALLIPLLPYAFELVALRRLATALFGVIMSLEPAIAALLGFLILDQGLVVSGIVAIGMVVLASAGATLGAAEHPAAPDEPVHGA
jgi:inner membrane transporter RhtA